MENNEINVEGQTEIKKVSIYVRLVKWAANAIANARWMKILKVYFVVFFFISTSIVCYFAYKAANNDQVMKQAALLMTKTRKEENLRDFVVTPKIQKTLSVILYTLHADRAFLFELHNGKRNTSGLPFRYADMSYEEINEEKKIDRIARDYQDVPITLYKYPHYLQKTKIMCGSVQDVLRVDSQFAEHMIQHSCEYIAIIYLTHNGNPLGFLCVAWHSIENAPSREVIVEKLREYDKPITQLLDLQTQMQIN